MTQRVVHEAEPHRTPFKRVVPGVDTPGSEPLGAADKDTLGIAIMIGAAP